MPYRISWLVPGRLMHIELHGSMTIEELRAMAQESITFTEQGTAPVHAVIDQQRVESIPLSLNSMMTSMRVGVQPNSGVSVLIGGSRFTRYITQMIYQVVRLDMRQAETFEAAIALLQRLDATLPASISAERPQP